MLSLPSGFPNSTESLPARYVSIPLDPKNIVKLISVNVLDLINALPLLQPTFHTFVLVNTRITGRNDNDLAVLPKDDVLFVGEIRMNHTRPPPQGIHENKGQAIHFEIVRDIAPCCAPGCSFKQWPRKQKTANCFGD